MIFSHITTTPGEVTSIRQRRDYIASPLSLYAGLDKPNSLLLESAEIESKDNVKSIVLVDSAIRFECNGDEVVATALSNNGAQLLPYLGQKVQNCDAQLQGTTLLLRYNSAAADIDEYSKLKADNAFSALRTCINEIQSNSDTPFAVFLAVCSPTTWWQTLKPYQKCQTAIMTA